MKLGEALAMASSEATYVNGSYPDMVNPFLWGSPGAPSVGIGNISNLVPGLRLAYARFLDTSPNQIDIRLICHHFTSLNGPTIGGSGGAPYHLTVVGPENQLTFDSLEDSPFELVKSSFPRMRGLSGQGVTISSASTVLASLLNGHRRRHHAPGPQGLAGGYPILITEDGKIEVDLPEEVSLSDALAINASAQKFDGVGDVRPGRIVLTETATSTLNKIAGIDLPEVTFDNAVPLAREIADRLNSRYGFACRL